MRAVYSAVQGNDIDCDNMMSAIYSMNSNGCVYLPMYITSSIRHLFGLGGWVGGSPSILSLFGFSEMSDNCRPSLKAILVIFGRGALIFFCLKAL